MDKIIDRYYAAIYTEILEELIKMIGEIKPKYSSIFELLYHGYNNREIETCLV